MDAIVRPGATIRAVAAYLTRFDAPPTAMALDEEGDDALSLESLFEPPAQIAAEPAPEPQVSREEIAAECEAKHVAAIEAARAEFELRLQSARERWAREQAEALSAQLARALNSAFETLRGDIARILSPFVAREIMARVMDDLVTTLRMGLSIGGATMMEIRGPKDLIENMKSALSDENVALTLHESDEVDAQVTFSSTTVETSLIDWMKRLSDERG